MENANNVRRIGLHEEVIKRTDAKYEQEFVTMEGTQLIFQSEKEALSHIEMKINRRTEFYLKDGRLLVQIGLWWRHQGQHDPNPVNHYDWQAYFSHDQLRISRWKHYCKIHLEKRKKFAEELRRGLDTVWLNDSCGK